MRSASYYTNYLTRLVKASGFSEDWSAWAMIDTVSQSIHLRGVRELAVNDRLRDEQYGDTYTVASVKRGQPDNDELIISYIGGKIQEVCDD